MNQEEKEIVSKSKEKFKKHRWLSVTLKKDVSYPYPLSPLESLIILQYNNFKRKEYLLYIHNKYLSIRCLGKCSKESNFEPVRFLLDDFIWAELYTIFDIKLEKVKWLSDDKDKEPI